MEARDPDDLPRVLSSSVWLEVSSDPWPFFRAKQACHGTEGLMEEFVAKMGEGAMKSSGLQMQEGKEAASGAFGLLPERSPQARNAGISFGSELFCQWLIDPLAAGKS